MSLIHLLSNKAFFKSNPFRIVLPLPASCVMVYILPPHPLKYLSAALMKTHLRDWEDTHRPGAALGDGPRQSTLHTHVWKARQAALREDKA